MVIHDLKAPLGTIINANLLSDDKNRIKVVQQVGRNMLNMVQNILDVYRYEDAKVILDKKRTNLSELFSSAYEEVGLLVEKGALRVDICNDINFEILIDREIIGRVVVNILSNAIKFAPAQSVVEIKVTDTSSKAVKISVINQGPAIAEHEQALIFEKFKQAANLSKKQKHSSGLGLAFCKMAIESHGGEIGVVSDSETGVEFWFTLPCNGCGKEAGVEVEKKGVLQSLTQADKAYLKEYVEALGGCEVYQISAINQILERIDKRNAGVVDWMANIEHAVYSGDSMVYRKLLLF